MTKLLIGLTFVFVMALGLLLGVLSFVLGITSWSVIFGLAKSDVFYSLIDIDAWWHTNYEPREVILLVLVCVGSYSRGLDFVNKHLTGRITDVVASWTLKWELSKVLGKPKNKK